MNKNMNTEPRYKFHCCLTNPCLLLTPAIVYESFYGMRNGPDCWKIYLGWFRFEAGIAWQGRWPRSENA